jgi:hypothetical protein
MTAQIPELIIIDGETHLLCEEPIEYYFQLINKRPSFKWPSTSLWRGYRGTWLIKNKQLYLTNLETYFDEGDNKFFNWRILFQNCSGDIKASWYSGTLRVPQGKILKGVNIGFQNIYEKDLFLTIKNGDVISSEIKINNS